MASDLDMGAKGDHLKYYCIIFGILVVVIGVVALMQRKTLNAYKLANKQGRAALMATGKTPDGRPRAVGELAVEVEKFVQGFRASSGNPAGGGGVGTRGITNEVMEAAERIVQVTRIGAGRETDDDDRAKGFTTRWREFKYGNCSLEQFMTLVRNVESWGRFRVFEVTWNLADARINDKPPFNVLNKPSMKVGFRTPLAKGR